MRTLTPVAAPYRSEPFSAEPHGQEDTRIDARRALAANAPSAPGCREAPAYHSVHVYGGRAALCFSADETRGGEKTVRIEAAQATAPKVYAWSEKVALQLTLRELPQVLAVVAGLVPAIKLTNHGEANDKGLSLENQAGGKLFVSLWQGKQARAVPVMPADVWPVMDLLLKQFLANSPHLSADAALASIRLLSQRYMASQHGSTRDA
jgi:hypothetical protein